MSLSLFFSAHLAAHEGRTFRQRRNSDVCEIFSGCRSELASKSSAALRSPISPALDLSSQLDFCFFVGDLNYRVMTTTNGDDPVVDEATVNNDDDDDDDEADDDDEEANNDYNDTALASIDFLRDELSLEMAENRVFCNGWIAPLPPFPPTFKVVRGYQRCVYNKKRIPSWCDRILFKVRDNTSNSRNSRVSLLDFDYIPQIKSSDHKPIRALFEIYPSPVRPLVQHETWRIQDVDLIIDTNILTLDDDDDDDTGRVSGNKNTPTKRKQSKAPQPPQLLLRVLTTPREILKADAASSLAPQSLTATWQNCLTFNLFLEGGTFASRGSLHLVACDARKAKEKHLGSADFSIAKIRSFTIKDSPFNFVSIPLVRNDLIIGRISGSIRRLSISH
mmetsp:Transcript_5372/g.7558  ORF Transcript_5372/g.7558 Transcript_5372/m.7558 type:complete len:391 (+) Transcript_5372:2217-3389(+)